MSNTERVLTVIAETAGCNLLWIIRNSEVNPASIPFILHKLIKEELINKTVEPLDRCLFTITPLGVKGLRHMQNKRKK